MKKVKIITIILAIILVSLISFVGIYMQTQNRMENKVKDYQLGSELEGRRVIELKISDTKTETDESGNETTVAREQSPEILTAENYEIVKNTIEKRLKNLGAQDYIISLNKEDGKIKIELEENENTDLLAYYLTASGEVKIVEKDTETELINDSMVKKASYNYATNADGEYQVYIELQLTKEGQAKLEEISNNYAILANDIEQIEAVQAENEENAEDTETSEESTETQETTEAEQENTETTENQEEQAETKKIAVLKIADTEYDVEKIEKNKITITVGSATTSNTTLNNNLSIATEMMILINSGKYPVIYDVQTNRYIYDDINLDTVLYVALAIIAIILITLVVITIRYRLKGLLSSFSIIGFIAVLLLLLRYTNILITIETIGAIIISIIINILLNISILNKIQKIGSVKEAVNNTYKEIFIKLIPVMIISIVFCFSGWTNLNNFGMTMFWGFILIPIYNYVVTRTLLRLMEEK